MLDDADEHDDENDLSYMEPKITCWTYLASHQNNYKFLTNLYLDDRRLPRRSSARYDMQFYAAGCPRYNGSQYKTQEDLDREREAAESLIPKVTVEIKGSLKWTFDEALEYLQEKAKGKQPSEWLERKEDETCRREQRKSKKFQKEVKKIKSEAATEKRKQKRKPRLTIDEIYYATMAKAGRELPKPKPAEPPEDRQYQETVARRKRQKAAMDSGAGFSTPQQPGSAGVITWSDPLITDARLVRLVLGTDRGSREMTAEEESDYWYWKAKEAMGR